MNGWRRTVTVLLLSPILISATSCNPFGGDKQDTSQQMVEVVRGELAISVSGSGNIEVANDMKLTFGVAGRIDKIYVEEGDEVSEGEELAKLDADSLGLALTQARVAQTKARIAMAQAQIAKAQAQIAKAQAQADVTQAQASLTQAQVNLKDAEIALELTRTRYSVSDIRAAEADVDVAQRNMNGALWTFSKYDPEDLGYARYQEVLLQAEAGLKAAKDTLDAMLTGFDAKEVASKKLKVEADKQSLKLAEQSLEIAEQSLEIAEQSLKLSEPSLELAKESLESARQSLELAQKQLDEVTITAPFDGMVASVAVDEKDTITTITTIIHLIDPTRMELNVEVDEIDVTDVRPGQRAIIELDALPALALEGKVDFISLLPTVEAGVILYDVEITFDATKVTGIRTGMSATANIITNERKNVLLVPDRAVKYDSQGNSVVEVTVNGQIGERTVVIGISDGFQTEIIDGLEEGEVVERRAKPN